MKKIIITLAILLLPAIAFSAKVDTPLQNSTMQAIGGADSSGNAQVLRVNPDGSISTSILPAPLSTPVDGIITITSVGATDRVQLPDLTASFCTIQAHYDNPGSIYIGGSTVTNKSGAKRGLERPAGLSLSNRKVNNANEIYIAADVSGSKVTYSCN